MTQPKRLTYALGRLNVTSVSDLFLSATVSLTGSWCLYALLSVESVIVRWSAMSGRLSALRGPGGSGHGCVEKRLHPAAGSAGSSGARSRASLHKKIVSSGRRWRDQIVGNHPWATARTVLS